MENQTNRAEALEMDVWQEHRTNKSILEELKMVREQTAKVAKLKRQ